MAVAFISTAKSFLSSYIPCSNQLPSPHSSSSPLLCPHKTHKRAVLCRAIREPLAPETVPISVSKRGLVLSLTATLLLAFAGSGNGNGFSAANAAILEADDDQELMERVKKDRQKRIERQGVLISSKQETGFFLIKNLPSLCHQLLFLCKCDLYNAHCPFDRIQSCHC